MHEAPGLQFASDCDCGSCCRCVQLRSGYVSLHGLEFALILYDSRKDRPDRSPHYQHPSAVLRLFQVQPPDRLRLRDAEPDRLVRQHPPFPIGGYYYCDGRFVRYEDIADVPAPMEDDMETTLRNIREKLIAERGKASGYRCSRGFPALERSGFLAGLLHCSQEAGLKPIAPLPSALDTGLKRQ